MPFRHIKPGTFEFDTMKQMQAAFDVVCERLSISADDTRRSKLATAIIELAAAGERDDLADKAEAALKKKR